MAPLPFPPAAGDGITAMGQAADDTDLSALRNACLDVTNPLTIPLPASLPTPDPDVTNVLQYLVDDGKALQSACDRLSDPPSSDQLSANVTLV